MSKTTLAWIGVGAVVVIVAVATYYIMTGASVPAGGMGASRQGGATQSAPSSATMTALPSGGANIAVPGQNATMRASAGAVNTLFVKNGIGW